MTLVSSIIRSAYRESNTVASTQANTPEEIAEALERLQAVVLSAVGAEAGYIMEDWNITDTAYTRPSGVPVATSAMSGFSVRPNSRLICNLAAALTLKLDPQPQDGQRFSAVDAKSNFATYNLTLNPNGRKIEGSAANLVLSADNTAKQWLYRSDLADWVILAPLTADLQMPFPEDFDDYFIIMLAGRLNPRFGQQLSAESTARLQQQQLQFVNRYTQSRLRSVPSPAASNPARTPES